MALYLLVKQKENLTLHQKTLGPCSDSVPVPGHCPGTKKDIDQTPWYPGSNRVLLRQFSARHFVCRIVGKHEEKT